MVACLRHNPFRAVGGPINKELNMTWIPVNYHIGDHPKHYVMVSAPDGTAHYRRAYVRVLGNFAQLSVTYKGQRYMIGNGDEHIRNDPPAVYALDEKRIIPR